MLDVRSGLLHACNQAHRVDARAGTAQQREWPAATPAVAQVASTAKLRGGLAGSAGRIGQQAIACDKPVAVNQQTR